MKDKAAVISKDIETQPRAITQFKSLKPIASLVDIKAPQDPYLKKIHSTFLQIIENPTLETASKSVLPDARFSHQSLANSKPLTK